VSEIVVDASAMVDALIGTPVGPAVIARLRGHRLHAPAHFDAEVLSALGRLQRAGALSERQVRDRLGRLAAAPVQRHPLPPLLVGAWGRRHDMRLVDALYAVLASEIVGSTLVTTDRGLASAASVGELITPPDH
jgi:predicted nucleic acid-binding protein